MWLVDVQMLESLMNMVINAVLLRKIGSVGFPGECDSGGRTEPLPRFSWTDVERFHEMELEEHWALKSIWMEELREVAIGEEGRLRTRPALGDESWRSC